MRRQTGNNNAIATVFLSPHSQTDTIREGDNQRINVIRDRPQKGSMVNHNMAALQGNSTLCHEFSGSSANSLSYC